MWHVLDLTGIGVVHADLLGLTAAGRIVHLEFQSTNDPLMALRMAEYKLQIYRRYPKFAVQVVLDVGRKRMKMPVELKGDGFQSTYSLVDMRTVDGDRLLASSDIGDDILAVLARLSDARTAVRRIVRAIARQGSETREVALRRLVLLSGLRKLEAVVEQEGEKGADSERHHGSQGDRAGNKTQHSDGHLAGDPEMHPAGDSARRA